MKKKSFGIGDYRDSTLTSMNFADVRSKLSLEATDAIPPGTVLVKERVADLTDSGLTTLLLLGLAGNTTSSLVAEEPKSEVTVAVTFDDPDNVISIYKEAAKTNLIAKATDAAKAGGTLVLVEQNNSGVSGYVTSPTALDTEENTVEIVDNVTVFDCAKMNKYHKKIHVIYDEEKEYSLHNVMVSSSSLMPEMLSMLNEESEDDRYGMLSILKSSGFDW